MPHKPMFHWQANQNVARERIAEASAAAKLALASFDGVVLRALRETESALTTFSRDRQREGDLATAQDRARGAEQQARRLYTGGKIDCLPFLDAQRTLASADDAVAASHARLATDQVALFLALGGGWEQGLDAMQQVPRASFLHRCRTALTDRF